jgi:SOS-response transcriptional repressor LexA
MKSIMGELEEWRRARGLKASEMARMLGAPKSQYYTNWVARDSLPKDYYPIAEELIAPGDYIRTPSALYNVSRGPHVKGYVPLISWVQAGVWSEAIDLYEPGEAEDVIPCPASHSMHSFALRVEGDSMTSATGKSYPPGSIIFVDPEQRGGVIPGDRVIAKLDGADKVTFKQLAEDRQGHYLMPLNPAHPAIYEKFSVLGKVIGKWEPE